MTIEKDEAQANSHFMDGPSAWQKASALLALVFGIWGSLKVANAPWLGLFCFAVGGLFLLLAVPAKNRLRVLSFHKAPAPGETWEPWFALFLFAVGMALFLWRLETMPEGAIYSEGFLASRSAIIWNGSWVAHDDFAGTNWPTLYHYQGMMAAKLFGMKAASFRLVSVFYGMTLLFTLWLVARQLLSPSTAAILALAWLGFHYNFHFARRYSPVLFTALPAVLALGLGVAGLRTKRLVYFIAAGAAAGLGLYGYFPGRLLPLIGLVFGGILWVKRDQLMITRRHIVAGVLSFLIVASPVFWYALRNSDKYNRYINQKNVATMSNATGWARFKHSVEWSVFQIKPYAMMFHVNHSRDSEQEDNSFESPVLDPALQVLAPLGLFIALFSVMRGVSGYLLFVFAIGLVPGMLIQLGVAPWERRGILSFPFVYLFAGVAFEYLRLSLTQGSQKAPKWLFLAVALLGTGYLGFRMIRHYQNYAYDVGFRQKSNADVYYANKEVNAHPGAYCLGAGSLVRAASALILFEPKNWPHEANDFLEFIQLDPERENLLLLAPWQEANIPLYTELYPHAKVKLFREPRLEGDDALMRNLPNLNYEIYNPHLYLISIAVPPEDAKQRHGMLASIQGAAEKPWPIFDKNGLRGLAGQKVRLAASIWVSPNGQTLTAELAWKGWKAKLDGDSKPIGKPFRANGGFRTLELEGKIPEPVTTQLPLSLKADGQDLVAQNKVFAFRFAHGWSVEEKPCGPQGETMAAKSYSSWRLMQPATRFLEQDHPRGCPYLAVVKAKLLPGTSGEYRFRAHWPGITQERVMMDGVLVNDRWQTTPKEPWGSLEAVQLKEGKAVQVEALYLNRCLDERIQGFSLQMQVSGSAEWSEVPGSWLSPE